MLRTRPATKADTSFLRELHHRAYREVVVRQFGVWDDYAQDRWFEKGLSEAEFSVIEHGGIPVGAIGTIEEPDHLWIVEMQILPEWQKKGFGTTILVEQMGRARPLGKKIRLRVLRENRARALYERHGLVLAGETETHYFMTS
jgi:GNAT superfamily N-acetyltransferase